MTIIDLIDKHMNVLTKTQRRVADYILKNTVQSAFSTVETLSQAIGISTNSVVRLAATIGFSSYSEFHNALQEYVMAQESPSAKLGTWINSRNTEKSIITEITSIQQNNIGNTLKRLSEEKIYEAAKMILDSSHIYVTAGRSSYAVAYFFMYNLARLTAKCDMLAFGEPNLPEMISRITKDDVIFTVNIPRYLAQTIQIVKLARERGAKVIAVTDSYASPLQPYSDILFFVEYKGVSFFNSMVSSLMVVEILLSVIADMIGSSSYEFMEVAEKVSKAIGLHPVITL